jgi:outer membrane protein insertion porin family
MTYSSRLSEEVPCAWQKIESNCLVPTGCHFDGGHAPSLAPSVRFQNIKYKNFNFGKIQLTVARVLVLGAWVSCLFLNLIAFCAERFDNLTIKEIRFSFSEPFQTKDLDKILPLHSGEPLDYSRLQACFQSLYETRLFSSLALDAKKEDGGVILTFLLTPNYFFADFKLQGDHVLKTSLSNLTPLPLGEIFSQQQVDLIGAKLHDKLLESGYRMSKVESTIHRFSERKLVEVIFTVQAGPRAILQQYSIQGVTALRPETIRRKIKVRSGRPFDRERLEKDLNRLKKLFASRGFLSAKIQTGNFRYSSENNSMTFDFLINAGPYIYVDLHGAKVPRKKLFDLVPFYEEGSIDQDLIAEGKRKLQDFFQRQGFFDVKVEAEDPIAVPEQNAYQVNYTIEKGKKQRVKSLQLNGLNHFSDPQVRPFLQTRTSSLIHRGNFSEDSLVQDKSFLHSLYRDAGYQQIQIEPSYGRDPSGRNLRVSFDIKENQITRVAKVELEGNRKLDTKQLISKLKLSPGTAFSEARLEEARKALHSVYEEAGFAEVKISPQYELNGLNAQVKFLIEEGESYRVSDIYVLGNELTRRKVITRNILFHEGYFFNESKVLQSEQSLYSLGLFSRINITPLNVRQPDHYKPVLIRIEDASPLILAYGVGYENHADYRGVKGVRGTFDVSNNNLFGLARSLSFRAIASYRIQRGQLTFKEPRLFNHDLEGLVFLYAENERRVSYVSQRNNATLQILKQRKKLDNFFFRYSYETVDLSDQYVNPLATGGEYLGRLHLSSLSTSWLRDTRDDPLDPQRGFFHSASCLYTSRAIGSEANYVQLFGQSQWAHKLNSGNVVASSLRLGLTFPFGTMKDGKPGEVPITERFFAGGPNTLRGFKLDLAGPLDPGTGKPLGGNAQFIGNVELRHSITNNFVIAPFYDTGNVFARVRDIRINQFTNTVGLGFRYKTPFGPLRLDVGYNLNPVEGAKNPIFFFTIGNPF